MLQSTEIGLARYSAYTVIYNGTSPVKKRRKRALDPATPAPHPATSSRWAAPALIAALVLVFYLIPLTSESASIQWDAADLHYPFQKYWSDHVRSASLPSWTPYIFAGYPFLAYPETGAWYPPHWPFFLAGITPRTIQAELALNALLACLGAFFLISYLVQRRAAAVLGGLCYGLSGFFAGHASHVGIFVAAACFPWLLWTFRRAFDGAAFRYTALGGMTGAAMVLAGYFQTAMYGFLALGMYALVDVYRAPRRWFRVVSIVAGMLSLAVATAAIQIVPTLELLENSFRRRLDYSGSAEGILDFRALATLLAPDCLGTISGKYTGPADATQYYFYAGILLLPLAVLGFFKTKDRLPALCLIVPSIWFMLGPTAGLYRVAMLLPGMKRVREPIQAWFVVALGLAMLAAAGLGWMERRWRLPYLGAFLVAVLFVDVWYWNLIQNPLAYGHYTFDRAYGNGEYAVERHVVPAVPPLTRFEGGRRAAVGPQDYALDLHLETTAGYAALPIGNYMHYLALARLSPKLRDGLNVSAYMSADSTAVVANPSVLPRVYFPKSIVDAGSRAECIRALESLDPHLQSVALAPHSTIRQDPAATATVLSYDDNSYRIRYHAGSPSLLRLSVPYFPGWRATVDGKGLPIVHVDLALMGVVVPAGDGELRFSFRSDTFGTGAAITLASLMLCFLLMAVPDGIRLPARGTPTQRESPALP
jgi:hypothetical protein